MKLVQCPDCQRQYDVGNLPPQAKVRSVCGRLLEVTWSKPMEVEVLACAHCGGAVQPHDSTCPWCEGGLSERDRRQALRCPACYTRMDSESRHCHACGVRIQPKALTPLPAEGGCPRCEGELAVRFLGDGDGIECTACGGLWLNPKLLRTIHVDAARRGREEGPFPEPPPVPIETDIRYLPCLTCGELMARRQFKHGARSVGVVVDLCKDHGVWLDSDELERITAFVRANPNVPQEVARPMPPGASEALARGMILENQRRRRVEDGLAGTLIFIGELLWGLMR